jgi:hypothetical protein
MRMSSSIASSEDEDIESGYTSEHDNISSNIGKPDPHDMIITVSKLTSNGKIPRRRSNCEQLRFRQASCSSCTGDVDNVPWLLPQMPPFSPTSTSRSSSQRDNDPNHHHIPILAALASAFILIGITILVVSQQHAEMTSLRSQLEIANQSRAYLEKSASDLHTTLLLRQTALNHCNQAHATTTRHNLEISDKVGTLSRELLESNREVERLMDRDANVATLMDVERKLRISESRWDAYADRIGQHSRRTVLEKYGGGPHHVELQVQLPASQQGDGRSTNAPVVETIKIELAPLDMMPHSVRVFLEQISSGMWDDGAFDLHAGHVLMAHSKVLVESANDKEVTPMMLPFPEYNANYPHDRYTIAFPAPSSNSNSELGFYINLQNNDVHHSPRMESFTNSGATTTSVGGRFVEGESCFGNIVDEASRRVVDRMDALSVDDGKQRTLEESVIIKTARVVGYGN